MSNQGFVIQEDPHLAKAQRFNDLWRTFVKIASRASDYERTYIVAKELANLTIQKIDNAYREALMSRPSEIDMCSSVGIVRDCEINSDSVGNRISMNLPTNIDVSGFARKGKKHCGSSSLAIMKSSLKKRSTKKAQQSRTLCGESNIDQPNTEGVLFDNPAMPTMNDSWHTLEVATTGHQDGKQVSSTIGDVGSQVDSAASFGISGSQAST
ncbi:hypothetical protein H6P81_016651 [Aristolochia fimbriata]|uniref:Uncharacterized protein n=1 Tax=Aristolochia fimbriata TaxID=158543 RepID=A0AAV7EA63_ARIFI|nr:hypothetical protein H6P81_016651 [Aristolochia fimbriata]